MPMKTPPAVLPKKYFGSSSSCLVKVSWLPMKKNAVTKNINVSKAPIVIILNSLAII